MRRLRGAGATMGALARTAARRRRDGQRTIARPHGRAPTGIVATTVRVAASMTETSLDRPLAV